MITIVSATALMLNSDLHIRSVIFGTGFSFLWHPSTHPSPIPHNKEFCEPKKVDPRVCF